MFFWFLGPAFAGVAAVFNSPAIDYRLVMAGALLPLVEIGWGPFVLHTLVFGVALMTAVMVVWRGRRLAQRRWLALPIGLFAHLVLDGTWADRDLFWWPLFGAAFGGDVPEAGRPLGLVVGLEVAGVAALAWAVHRYGLVDPARRSRFLRTGHLDRSLVG